MDEGKIAHTTETCREEARLAHLEQAVKDREEKLRALEEEIRALEEEIVTLKEEIRITNAKFAATKRELEHAKKALVRMFVEISYTKICTHRVPYHSCAIQSSKFY